MVVRPIPASFPQSNQRNCKSQVCRQVSIWKREWGSIQGCRGRSERCRGVHKRCKLGRVGKGQRGCMRAHHDSGAQETLCGERYEGVQEAPCGSEWVGKDLQKHGMSDVSKWHRSGRLHVIVWMAVAEQTQRAWRRVSGWRRHTPVICWQGRLQKAIKRFWAFGN